MATRRSMTRAMRALHSGNGPNLPMAILTGWRTGRSRVENDNANCRLIQRFIDFRLSWVPVVGCWVSPCGGGSAFEMSFLVRPSIHPRLKWNELFLNCIHELLFNPANEPLSGGSVPLHCQEGAIVKLPLSRWRDPKQCRLVHPEWAQLLQSPTFPPATKDDYTKYTPAGADVEVRVTASDFTQMLYGPRASGPMRSTADKPTDPGSLRNKVTGLREPGRRFTVVTQVVSAAGGRHGKGS